MVKSQVQWPRTFRKDWGRWGWSSPDSDIPNSDPPDSALINDRDSFLANEVERARMVLQSVWGYADFRPDQLQAIESILKGRDTLALLPTGGGKSIAFQVPAIVLGGLTVVVSPLISLMQDQVAALSGRGVPCFALSGRIDRGVAAWLGKRIRESDHFLLYT
ncbi:MAG: DEAD/DEAH box helicase, partial [Bacteroidetes bacterium]|nr:DEAD/DEAH box helicase [Bacteroidota bacterium]